jgi:hypothetical protein
MIYHSKTIARSLIPFLVDALDKSPAIELAHEFIRVLDRIIERASGAEMDTVFLIGRVLLTLATSGDVIQIRLRVLLVFSAFFNPLACFPVRTYRVELLELVDKFLQQALDIAGVVTNDHDLTDCQCVLATLLKTLRERALPYAKSILAGL